MKILTMTASFGKLQKQELTLADGLNVLTAPNESGKSTWAAFILAMLYGIDSGERTTKTNLPAKAKYKPWSGAPMEGRMEVEHQGRRIVLERWSKGRTPMGEFRAYDADTMQPVPGMTGENCGLMLLGAERSVFERSAFVAQNGAAVTADGALERKLASLVTTGDETTSYSASEKRLRDWKNHCQHNRTGLLPEARAELETVEQTLEQIHALHRGDLELHAKQAELTNRKSLLERQTAALKATRAAQQLRQKEQAREAADEAAARRDALAAKAARLPSPETLRELSQQLTILRRDEAALPARAPEKPTPPECPAVFAGLSAEQVLPKAQRDKNDFDRLATGKRQPATLFLIVAAILALSVLVQVLTGAAAENFPLPLLTGGCAVVWLILWLLARKKNRALEARRDEAYAILAAYDNRSGDELVPYAAEYHEKLLLHRHRMTEYEAKHEAYASQHRSYAEGLARAMGQTSMFAPEADSLTAAEAAVRLAMAQHEAADKAAQAAREAQHRYEAVCTALGTLTDAPPVNMVVAGLDADQVGRELLRTNSELTTVQRQLDQNRGRVDALGDPARLQARREALQERITRLEARLAALTLAAQTLEGANADLQTRFAPQIAALSGELLARLTGNRYDAVLLDADLRAEAREQGEAVTRQLLYLSGGTADQVYLAVRLAICRLALGDEAPLVLDDALVHFDDERMRQALRVLQEEAERRQILLFTCQERERAALEQLEA